MEQGAIKDRANSPTPADVLVGAKLKIAHRIPTFYFCWRHTKKKRTECLSPFLFILIFIIFYFAGALFAGALFAGAC